MRVCVSSAIDDCQLALCVERQGGVLAGKSIVLL